MKTRLATTLLALTLLFPVRAWAADEADHIKWVEFNVPYSALTAALDYDLNTYGTEPHLNWIELLAFLGAKYGGTFENYRKSHLDELVTKLQSGEQLEDITSDMEHYDYYHKAYDSILGEFVGMHSVNGVERYGLKAFSPIAMGFGYSHFDDFGVGRNYGYNRRHLGHDMFGAVGTPIIAIESGVVEAMGWNQYGGWRVGIRSFDGLRYYYYAHLRQNRPFHPDIAEGQVVKAGDVIGYMGRTGYSKTENTNGIRETHLHWGLQLIFHPDQKDGTNQIWVDAYNITRLLQRNQSETYRVAETKEFYPIQNFNEPNLSDKPELEEKQS